MRYFLLGFLLMTAVGASAQSAADQYHDAARLYIDGKMAVAEQAAEAGLAIDPNDEKLQALLERIRQQQEQQQSDEGEQSEEQQNEQNDQENDGESEQQDSEQQNDEQGERDLPRDDGSTEADGQEEHQPEQQADQQNQDGREDERQEPNRPLSNEDEAEPEDTQPVQLGRMSRAEAERILAALRADESALLRSIRRRPASPRRVERDW